MTEEFPIVEPNSARMVARRLYRRITILFGQPNGLATLGPDGIVPASQLPPGGGGIDFDAVKEIASLRC